MLRALMAALPGWSVVAGGSVRVTDSFCPIPDIAVYPSDADEREPSSQGRDARLVVEVGVSTAWTDRSVKLSAYAAGAIDEVWLVVPDAGLLSCHRAPRAGRYHDEVELTWPVGLSAAVDQLVTRLS